MDIRNVDRPVEGCTPHVGNVPFSTLFWGGTTWTEDFKCREVKTGFCRKRWVQTGSSGTLIGWKSGQTTNVPLWDRMEGAWLWTLYRIISKRRCILLRNCSLEKNQVPREPALIAISLTCLVAQLNSYGGSWKWVTILPILVEIVQLLFAIRFYILHMCTNNCIHLIVKSLDIITL